MESKTYPDATVVAASRWFHWVMVNRDHADQKALPKRFNVSAYPSLLVLGPANENIHRWHGFKPPDGFLPQMREGARRWDDFRHGREWHTPNPRPARLTDAAPVHPLEPPLAPAAEVPGGSCIHAGRLRVNLRGRLWTLADGRWQAGCALPAGTQDLASDGTHLYAMPGGWTAGKPITVLDAATGETLRTIVTAANRKNRSYGAKGIAWRDGRLWVLEGMRGKLHVVDPATGDVERVVAIGRNWLGGLGYDGTHFVTAGRDAVYWIDPESGATVRELPVHYWLRNVEARDGVLYALEQPVRGFDQQHQGIWVWPKQTVVHAVQLP